MTPKKGLYNTTKVRVNEFSTHRQGLTKSCQVYFDEHSNSWRWQTAPHPSFQITALAIKPSICRIPATVSFHCVFMCCYITIAKRSNLFSHNMETHNWFTPKCLFIRNFVLTNTLSIFMLMYLQMIAGRIILSMWEMLLSHSLPSCFFIHTTLLYLPLSSLLDFPGSGAEN